MTDDRRLTPKQVAILAYFARPCRETREGLAGFKHMGSAINGLRQRGLLAPSNLTPYMVTTDKGLQALTQALADER